MSVASGDGLSNARTDEAETFQILAKDRFGNLRKIGGDIWAANLVNQATSVSVVGAVKDNGDGSYSASYTLQNSGNYQLSISLNGGLIQGAPFAVTCRWSGLSTPVLAAIGGGGVGLLVLIGLGVFIYKKKFSKRRLYQPLDK
jgi:hypothetical protein